NGLLTDHAPVSHNADLANAKAPPHAINDGNQRGDVGGVAGPQLAAERPARAIQDRSDDQLLLIGPVIFAVAVPTQRRAPLSLEIQRRGIEEDYLHFGEQVPPPGEQLLLDYGLAACFAPEFFKDQRRAPMARVDHGQALLLMLRKHQQLLREACPRCEQGINLTAGLKLVETAQRGQNSLLGSAIAPMVFDYLEIRTRA